MSNRRGGGANNRNCPQQMGIATENFRIRIDQIIRDFMNDDSCDQYPFPPDLNNTMRRYIHERCPKLGIKSKSYGKEPNRVLVIFKKRNMAGLESFELGLSAPAADLLLNVEYPSGKQKLNKNKRLKMQGDFDAGKRLLSGGMITVEKPAGNPLQDFRKSLPIFEQREVILNAIKNNQIVIVSAETGSGKTTQIPQYILEDAIEKSQKVKVICTQPRRLSTISVASRVAAERGERLGHVVGYQIKLESNFSYASSLIYCTNGILLRSFIIGEEGLKNVSHIIIDEIHERDKFTDFLLICIKEQIKKNPHVRVVIMSATMDLDIFLKYFENPMVVNVQGRTFDIQSIFLDDILMFTNYENAKMKQLRTLRERNGATVPKDAMIKAQQPIMKSATVEQSVAEELDALLVQCIEDGSEDNFVHLLQLILNENVSPNYQEPDRQLTPLMVAAAHGNVEILEKLLNLGADPFLACKEGLTASGWAQRSNNEDVVRILSMYQNNPGELSVLPDTYNPSAKETSQILADYDRTVSEEFIDFDLVTRVLEYVHNQMDRTGAILVFLPGYDDIMTCADRLKNSKALEANQYKVFMLHGSMQTDHQSHVFGKMPQGKQKIILSTNIAETSITIDDVRYVVDTGKVKMKCYDSFSGISSLQAQWISMASAMQRAGRAGRTQPGICFHLYSMNRYNSFCINTTPEILRVPLHELCLHAKTLAPQDISIQQFLNLAIEPPMPTAVNTSINVLKNLGAIDSEEDMTQLGRHLVQLSIEPHLGKMLIYSVIFKCLDPVLTIVASLAHKDPFVLPINANARFNALTKRRDLSEESLSDHFTLLRAYQMWNAAKCNSMMHRFCDEYFVSVATMELIVLTRQQLLTQLRSKGFVQTNNGSAHLKELNIHSNNWALVKACVCAGLYPNTAFYNEKKLHTRTEKNVLVNANSCLKQCEYLLNTDGLKRKSWFLYEELSKVHAKCSIRCATAVTPLTVGLVCGLNVEEQDGGLILDDWFELKFHNANVPKFRLLLDKIVQKKIEDPFVQLDTIEQNAINTLAHVLREEDIAYDFKQPTDVGGKPRLLINSHYPLDRRQEKIGGYMANNTLYPQQWVNIADPSAGQLDTHNTNANLFPPDSIYIIIKTNDGRILPPNWRFSNIMQKKLPTIPLNQHDVVLLFANNAVQSFVGIARYVGNLRPKPPQVNGELLLEWLTHNELPFHAARHIIQPRFIQDGYQVQSCLGQFLCSAIYDSSYPKGYSRSSWRNHPQHANYQNNSGMQQQGQSSQSQASQSQNQNQGGDFQHGYNHRQQQQQRSGGRSRMRPILGKNYD